MRKSSIGWKIDSKTKQEVTNADKEIVVQKGAQLGKYFCQEKYKRQKLYHVIVNLTSCCKFFGLFFKRFILFKLLIFPKSI